MFFETLAQAAATAATAPAAGSITLAALVGVIVIALIFDFLNGFHDAANSIATIVSTRVLSPTTAVIWAAFFNFVAAFIFGTKVAGTISKDLVHPNMIDMNVIAAAVIGAIVWNIITWLLGLPTSSSHALVGALGGAAVLKSGLAALVPAGWYLIFIGIILAPTLGFLLGSILIITVAHAVTFASRLPQKVGAHPSLHAIRPFANWIGSLTTPHRVDRIFRKLQLLSAAFYSLGHGGNDAQKTMGIIVIALTAAGQGYWVSHDPAFLKPLDYLSSLMPVQHNIAWWVILVCHVAIALGTCFGGWRIVKTMGTGITRLQPVGGFCAETSAAITIAGFTKIGGVPISTTHAITGAILGVGATHRLRSVRWIWGQRIVMAWLLTIPCSAFVAGVAYLVIRHLLPLY